MKISDRARNVYRDELRRKGLPDLSDEQLDKFIRSTRVRLVLGMSMVVLLLLWSLYKLWTGFVP